MFTHTLKATGRSLLFSAGRAGVRVGAVVTPRRTARHVAQRFFTTDRAAPERRRFVAEPPQRADDDAARRAGRRLPLG